MQLFHDAGAVLLFPVPALLQKAVPAQIVLVDALLLQLVDDLDLGGDGRVVRARLPQSLVALHPLVADQDILHGVVQGVSHVQLSGDIGRGHHDGEGLFVLVHLGVEILSVQPLLVQAVLNVRRIVSFFQFFH